MPSSVNHWNHESGSGTVNSVTIAPTAGNNLIVAVNQVGSTSITISDNLGTITWNTALARSSGSGGAYISIYYAENIPSGLTTITATFGGGLASSIFVNEVSGLATTSSLDIVSTISGANSASPSSNPVTPTVSGDYAFAFLGTSGTATTVSSTWGSGFTLEDSVQSSNPRSGWADIVAGTGAVSTSTTLGTSENWSMAVALFKAATSGSYSLSLTKGSYTWTGENASFSIPSTYSLSAIHGSYTIGGQAITLASAGPSSYNFLVGSGRYNTSGAQAVSEYTIGAVSGLYTFNGITGVLSPEIPIPNAPALGGRRWISKFHGR